MIRLLIVDDSALMRRLLSEIFAQAEDFEIATARSGEEALKKLHDFAPHVVTLDVHMPDMDGLACLDRIMVERPCPVVMVSSLTAEGADETLEAMALGAVDVIAKPRGAVSLEMDAVAPLLVEKVRAAASAKVSRATRLTERVRLRTGAAAKRKAATTRNTGAVATVMGLAVSDRAPLPADGVVLVGCSTGGPPALDALLEKLPADFPWPIMVAQHMPASFTGALARRLDKLCALAVEEVARPVRIEPGRIYIGRGDADLIVTRRSGTLHALSAPSSPDFHWHPSVDRLVDSAMAHVAPEKLIGVLMTGMGADGARAMAALHRAGGRTIAEAEESAVVWGMPGALVAAGGADLVAPLDQLGERLIGWFGR